MAFKPVTSAANPTIKRLASLRQKKYRQEENLFLLEGLRHVQEALAAGWTPAVLVAENPDDLPQDLLRALPKTCETLSAPHDLLQKITGRDNAERVVAAFAPVFAPAPTGVEASNKRAVWLLLESLRDPGNLGTILRTAQGANAAGVILLGETCDPWSVETVRASMGSCLHVGVTALPAAEFASWRKGFKGRLIGTDVGARAQDFKSVSYQTPVVIALGNEQSGLSPAVLAACDQTAHIPMPGGTESLNVGIAAALLLYEGLR